MTGRRILHGVMTLALVAASTGCDDAAAPIPPPIHDVGEPWQAAPFGVDPAVIAEAERVCRDPAFGLFANGALPLVLADARGGSALYLLFAAGGNDAQCFVERQANGRFVNQSGGSSSGGGNPPGLAPKDIEFGGANSQTSGNAPGETRSFASGRAGGAIAAVEVVFGNGRTLQATLNGGWFAAWWPTADSVNVVRGYDGAGTLVGSNR